LDIGSWTLPAFGGQASISRADTVLNKSSKA